MKIVIIGAGIIGASIFNELTDKYKDKVTIIEQGRIAELGATSVSGGIVRCFDQSSEIIEQAKYSLDKYKNFKEYADAESVFVETGCVYPIHIAQDLNDVMSLIERLKVHLNLEFIDQFQLEVLTPATNWKDYHGAILEKEAGYFCPKYATRSLINFGIKKGGNVLEHTKCLKVLHHDNQVQGIQTDSGIIEANLVIICGGAWTSQLALKSEINLPKKLRTKAIQMAKFKKDNSTPQKSPAFIDEKSGLYGRTTNLNQLMIGIPTDKWDIEPDTFIHQDHKDHFLKIFTTAHPIWKLNINDFQGHICMFDAYTEDEKPIVQPSELEGLYWATGFSGGGFKFAPAIAKSISNLIN
jgi:sarcosine oxidase, subunit beta